MIIIDGKSIAKEIQSELKELIRSQATRPPCLVAILVGNHPASLVYVERKSQACLEVGINLIKKHFPESITERELEHQIQTLNSESTVDGILVQLPFPSHINPLNIQETVCPSKDVDGFHPTNMGKLLMGAQGGFIPCTPLGIMVLFERMGIQVSGKRALVLGRSNIVGKPMAALLMQRSSSGNATVTIAHRHSQELQNLCLQADILISAMGLPHYVKSNMVKEGAVVIDVGINKISSNFEKKGYSIVGDIDFEDVAPKCSYITPVPGGIGPMTIAMLLKNTWKSYVQRCLPANVDPSSSASCWMQ